MPSTETRGESVKDDPFADRITSKQKIKDLEDVYAHLQGYLLTNNIDIEISHDCWAWENPYFKTLNYTSYAGCLILHPLSPQVAQQQMQDALIDADHSRVEEIKEYFKNKILTGNASKYNEIKKEPKKICKDLIILPGTNKVREHISMFKLGKLNDECESLAIKPHPLTDDVQLKEINNFFKGHYICSIYDDLYKMLKGADRIHTTHLSESVLYSAVLGKEITSIEKIQSIKNAAFMYINSLVFGRPKDKNYVPVCAAMTSYKSGVINPDIDPLWKSKVEKYIDYILEVRENYKGCYV